MWVSYFYFNAKITDQDGEEIPVREAFYHFIRSPVWKDLKNSLIETWNYAQQHGWMETWRQVVEMSDPYGENNAYTVLKFQISIIFTRVENWYQSCDTGSRNQVLGDVYHMASIDFTRQLTNTRY